MKRDWKISDLTGLGINTMTGDLTQRDTVTSAVKYGYRQCVAAGYEAGATGVEISCYNAMPAAAQQLLSRSGSYSADADRQSVTCEYYKLDWTGQGSRVKTKSVPCSAPASSSSQEANKCCIDHCLSDNNGRFCGRALAVPDDT